MKKKMQKTIIIWCCIGIGIIATVLISFIIMTSNANTHQTDSPTDMNANAYNDDTSNANTNITDAQRNDEGNATGNATDNASSQSAMSSDNQEIETETTANSTLVTTSVDADVDSAIGTAVSTQNGFSINQSSIDANTAREKFYDSDASGNFLTNDNDMQLASQHISDFLASLDNVTCTNESERHDDYTYVTRTYVGTITGDYTKYTNIDVSGQRGALTMTYVIQMSDMKMVSASIDSMSATKQLPGGITSITMLTPD